VETRAKRLPARRLFPGPARKLDPQRARFVGQAHFDGGIALFERPRAEIERMLPPGLALAWSTSSDMHPVVYLFGEQREGTLILGGRPIALGIRYPEVALAVPFVRGSASRYLHTWMAYMATSHEAAAWSGARLYGYAKELARLERDTASFRVLDSDGACRVCALVRARDDVLPGEDALDAVREMFRLPIVGRNDTGLVSSFFDWSFADAEVRAIDVALEWIRPPLAGFAAGTWNADAAFAVRRMRWRVSWPEPFRP
jgi:hypothetical protein